MPSTDIGSTGPYGVYHSVFDNYAWFVMNADPTFVYEQQMARVFGLETLHMADTDVLPYDYVTYARQIQAYLFAAQARARDAGMLSVDFNAALAAANRFTAEATLTFAKQLDGKRKPDRAECIVARGGGRFAWRRRGFLAGPGSGTPSLLRESTPGMPRSSSPV